MAGQELSALFVGRVCSGRGWASGNLAEAAEVIAQRLGERPVPGSLNLILARPVAFDVGRAILSVDEKWHFWPVAVNGHTCLAYRWNACPLHVLEVVSSCHLRSALGLVDGARVAVDVMRDDLLSVPLAQQAVWAALWGWTGQMFYTSDAYLHWIRRRRRLCRRTTQGWISRQRPSTTVSGTDRAPLA